ncbi:MAG: tRNA-(ms[2]io[6]A)-hydroxylase [Bacteroidia bacterium]|nr:tRNA-(ms[2]io[6]A)-hydroxylase [Bacteroidia bacterium]MDW8159706.1 tRNA-(ms[2]io[6]A)-hydroxylase [Bacteroidia bacterium]
MLGLKLTTDARWAKLAQSNLAELLTDHAFCEQKAASNAISLIVNFPEYPELVQTMCALVKEEISHFERVHAIILAKGWQLGRERKDDYVNELAQFIKKGSSRIDWLVDRLLFAAMIEARSCERFRLLSQTLEDKELAAFYHELMVSEANHYTTFIKLAKKYGDPSKVEKRWQEFLDYEAQLISRYGNSERVHG